ncbi:alpha/beta fold hydrolase [Labrenzia sp. VG12]|uniref:alpha/beta fold hydrolase n=1 Tax=Labrenzia sp. VG12 TaxID=2021862 RepID=UPI000B8C0533|nr:alpha/beta fold hydrolase [Labrenzia sp. VG12]ASP34756.1 alpha/beta hydrolase [Labrenzia sp. VG12]
MGDPILFIPGLLCTETLFSKQIVAFADRPIMVANHREHDSIAAIAESILAEAPERFSLIALSMGGYVAMEIMRKAPERVSKLALMNTNARADREEQSERRRFLIEMTRKRGFKKVPHLLYPGFVHEQREEDEGLRAIVVDMANDTGPEAFIRQQTALINRIDSRPSLGDIRCPTLVVVGEGDRLTPVPVSEEIHAHIPGSELVIVEGSGHLSPLEEPDRVTRVLRDFLNQA